MKRMLIINGYPRAGKTVFAKMIAKHIEAIERSSIDLVKEYAAEYFDWDGTKNDESRLFLSNLKKMLIEQTDLIEKDIEKHYNSIQKKESAVLIVDIREINEIKKYKEKYGALTVFVDNDRVPTKHQNDSDALVEQYKYDIYIDNSKDFEHLDKQARELVEGLLDKSLKFNGKVVGSVKDIDEVHQYLYEHSAIYRNKGELMRMWVTGDDLMIDYGDHNQLATVINGKSLVII